MARTHCTPAFLERRSAAQRAEMLRQLRADFGAMTLVGNRRTPDRIVLDVAGSSGVKGRATLAPEEAPSRRIDRFGIELGTGGDDGGPVLPPPPVTASTTDADLPPALDEWLMTTRAAAGEFSGVVLVARGTQALFARGYGEADRTAHVPNTPDVRFNIGSINKTFTHIAILPLIAAGRLKPTDSIGALIPDYPNADARVATVQQLLDYRAGIADFFGPAYASVPKDRLQSNRNYLDLVAAQPLTSAPGTRRQYCNGCYIVLGEVVARVSGRSYEEYVAQHVFRRAGMTRTGFLGASPRPGTATRHQARIPALPGRRPTRGRGGAGEPGRAGRGSARRRVLSRFVVAGCWRVVARSPAVCRVRRAGDGGGQWGSRNRAAHRPARAGARVAIDVENSGSSIPAAHLHRPPICHMSSIASRVSTLHAAETPAAAASAWRS